MRKQLNNHSRFYATMTSLSVICFLCSLLFDGFYTEEPAPGGGTPGLILFLLGWLGLLFGHYSWLANPIIFMSWKLTANQNFRLAIVSSTIATCLGLSFLYATGINMKMGSGETPIVGYGIGYWLWVATMILSLIASMYGHVSRTIEPNNDPKQQVVVSAEQRDKHEVAEP